MRRKRLVLSPWKLWLMNQPFRILHAAARGFGPGAGNALRASLHALQDWMVDPDRLRWWLARALNLRRGHGRN